MTPASFIPLGLFLLGILAGWGACRWYYRAKIAGDKNNELIHSAERVADATRVADKYADGLPRADYSDARSAKEVLGRGSTVVPISERPDRPDDG